MKRLEKLLQGNRDWAAEINRTNPDFFATLAKQQAPEYLWIGCSDSRVPANEILGMLPGDVFVHRNVSNLVIHTDMNCLSVLQYAVQVLKVKHIMVVGHYGCGGVRAALETRPHGLIDNWLRHVRDVYMKHRGMLATIEDEHQRMDRLCELNVLEQVNNVCNTTVVQEAWGRDQELMVNGWIYGLHNGLLNDLGMNVSSAEQVDSEFEKALQKMVDES